MLDTARCVTLQVIAVGSQEKATKKEEEDDRFAFLSFYILVAFYLEQQRLKEGKMVKFVRFDEVLLNVLRADQLTLTYRKETGEAVVRYTKFPNFGNEYIFKSTEDKFREFVVDFQIFLENQQAMILDIEYYKKS